VQQRQVITLLVNIIPYFPNNLVFTNRGDYDERNPLMIGEKVLCVYRIQSINSLKSNLTKQDTEVTGTSYEAVYQFIYLGSQINSKNSIQE